MSQKPTAKLALGTVQFGLDYGISNLTGRTPKSEVARILKLAELNNINTLDTAKGYGESEAILGELGVEDFHVISKLTPSELKNNTAETLVKQSLKALRLSKLYSMLFHNAESAMQYPGAVQELQAQKVTGIISKWGYSVYNPEELEQLLNKYELPDLIQVPYNHLDNRFEPLLKELHANGVEIHTRSTFLQGVFFMNPEQLSKFFNPLKDYLVALQEGFGSSESMASALLFWVLEKPFIDKVVIGVNTKRQLESNIRNLGTSSAILLPKPFNVPNELLMPNLWPKN
ncbi:aldo/keto reductase [Roseivirga pacifica]|uniref:aldo/keto reductase n=1 Tax=Roseivirga pacifica TaxID=1267423 RepID=UPI00227BAA96|nr:aldo/keto reductase [Roseivirga pacifica]